MQAHGTRYAEYAVHEDLAPFVKSIWSLESDRPIYDAPASGRGESAPGFFSYDRAAKKFMLRQFHIEGFVNQFVQESISEDGQTLVFVTTAIENIAPGWRGRESYRFLNHDEFIETFALSEPGKDFVTYSETYFRRK